MAKSKLPARRVRIAVDIGGTFTDGVAELAPHSEILTAKELTTPDDPSRAVADVVGKLLAEANRLLAATGEEPLCVEVVHGTTLVTNAIIERHGVSTALVVTKGTADTLDIGREMRYDLYDLDIELPKPLVTPDLRFEIDERVNAAGAVIKTLDEAEVDRIIAAIARTEAKAVAVCLLHAYANPAHEQAIGARIRQKLASVSVSLSSAIAGEIGEYERMSTTVANAYVQPIAATYISRLRRRLNEVGADAPLRIMVSSGGFTSDATAADAPIVILESGPAGGVLSALNTAALAGIDDVLTLDMGGTTAKACVATGGRPSITYRFEAARAHRFKKGSGLPIVSPSIDLIEIGAGGGSIAQRSRLGLLNVGPQSSGAVPGPACYGRGGLDATVTDANLLLGYLDPGSFLGGRMALKPELAAKAVARLAESLNVSSADAAWGICEVVTENMAAASRVHVAEKGLDPRRLTMIATGGAGPVHAVEVAARLRIDRVLCTIAAGVGSCLGFLAAPARADRSWSRLQPIGEVAADELASAVERMRASAEAELAIAGVARDEMQFTLAADMRYLGQGHVVVVERPCEVSGPPTLAAFARAFDERYEALFGRTVPGALPQVVTWRVTGQSGGTVRDFRHFAMPAQPEREDGRQPRRKIFLPASRAFGEVPVYQRSALATGRTLQGPLLIEEPESTIIVARPAAVTVLGNGTVSIALAGQQS